MQSSGDGVVQINASDNARASDEATGLKMSEDIRPHSRSWRDQWDRTQRWYERFRETHTGRLHNRSSLEYEDEMFAFFETCFQLKDWLKNDPASPVYRTQAVEEFVNGSAALRWCAEIANGSKHLVADKTPRVDPHTGLGRRLIKLEMGNTVPTSISAEYLIVGAGETRDAWGLATACLEEWRRFFREHDML